MLLWDFCSRHFSEMYNGDFPCMVEKFIKVFKDYSSLFGDSFDQCLHNLAIVLKRCVETNLILNWEKYHFMVEDGIVLDHWVFVKGIEFDRAKA